MVVTRKLLYISLVFIILLSNISCYVTRDEVRTDSYDYIIGVSLSNVMEPWLSNLVDDLSILVEGDDDTNIVFRDGANSIELQIEGIKELITYGVDILVVASDNIDELTGVLDDIYEDIPIILVGTSCTYCEYTSFIGFDDEAIGRMGGSYIIDNVYRPGMKTVVLYGNESSSISRNRLEGLQDVIKDHISNKDITYLEGEWMRDKADNIMKSYLVSNEQVDIVFALNDEMAYGAYIANEQMRIDDVIYIGVDGFAGEYGGAWLVDNGILNATIWCAGMSDNIYDTAKRILEGRQVDKEIKIKPFMIEANR